MDSDTVRVPEMGRIPEFAAAFGGSLRERLGAFGIESVEGPHAGEGEREIAVALRRSRGANPELILIAGAASIADADDHTPRALRAVGGEILRYGVPTEPGSLLLLGRHAGRRPAGMRPEHEGEPASTCSSRGWPPGNG